MSTHASPDDALISRASRSGARAVLQALQALCTEHQDWERTGALEQGRDPAKTSWPASWDDATAKDWFHRSANGLHHLTATWIKPGALVAAWLNHPRISFRGAAHVASLSREGDVWQVNDSKGKALAEAPLVVVCTAFAARQLLPGADPMPLDLVAGQVAMAPHRTALTTPLNGNGHLVPDVPGDVGRFWLSGSTYERMPLEDLNAAAGLDTNRARLVRLLAPWPEANAEVQAQFARGEVQRWTGERCTSIDRLPVVGEWLPGLHVSAAQGSRGLCFAALCAELLVAHLAAEPLPLDARLADAFAAKRFQRPT